MEMKIQKKIFESEIKEFNEQDLTVVHFISTEKRDRGGDILYADGMKILGRPVVLFQHGWNDEVGLEPIAKNIWLKPGELKKEKGIMAKTKFYPDELGKRLWKKNIDGYMPNWSVGWRPLEEPEVINERGMETRHIYS